MAIDTKPNLNNDKFEQRVGDTLTLSGITNIHGTFSILSGATFSILSGATLSVLQNRGAGKILTSDANGIATWQTDESVNGADNGLTLSGNKIILGGTLTGNTEINANNNVLTISNVALHVRGTTFISGLTNSTKSNVVYYDLNTNELTYGASLFDATIGVDGDYSEPQDAILDGKRRLRFISNVTATKNTICSGFIQMDTNGFTFTFTNYLLTLSNETNLLGNFIGDLIIINDYVKLNSIKLTGDLTVNSNYCNIEANNVINLTIQENAVGNKITDNMISGVFTDNQGYGNEIYNNQGELNNNYPPWVVDDSTYLLKYIVPENVASINLTTDKYGRAFNFVEGDEIEVLINFPEFQEVTATYGLAVMTINNIDTPNTYQWSNALRANVVLGNTVGWNALFTKLKMSLSNYNVIGGYFSSGLSNANSTVSLITSFRSVNQNINSIYSISIFLTNPSQALIKAGSTIIIKKL